MDDEEIENAVENENDDTRGSFINRIGTFFILLGILIIILFIASDMGSETYFSYFYVGGILLIIGFILKRTSPPPPSANARFEMIRNFKKRRREGKR